MKYKWHKYKSGKNTDEKGHKRLVMKKWVETVIDIEYLLCVKQNIRDLAYLIFSRTYEVGITAIILQEKKRSNK